MQQRISPDDLDYVQDARVVVRDRAAKRSTLFLFTSIAFLVVAVVWADFAELEEVTRGEGRVIPSSKTQLIQSLEGGIVKSLLVREGDRVSKGQVLGRIDDTSFSSNLGELHAKEVGLAAKVARLRFEVSKESSGNIEFSQSLIERAPKVVESEKQLHELRNANLANQIGILKERLQEKKQELAELKENQIRFADGRKIAQKEYDLKEPLARQGIVAKTDVLRLERELSDLKGQLAATNKAIPRVEASVRAAERAIDEQTLNFRQGAQAELSTVLAELSIVEQSLKGATDKVVRAEMRSPVDGIVNKIHVNTVGGVVRMGEPIMEITPIDENLFVEIRIDPKDVAFVGPGQPATVKLTAYDFTIYGSLDGKVEVISSDSILDKSTNTSYYLVTIKTTNTSLRSKNKELPIIPGMVATADIITGKKSVLEYLLKPIIKARHEALRER
ncbi:MAG: HlyD family type I secretion periplasmic adaptor subunit [Pseudomonadota bacterium]